MAKRTAQCSYGSCYMKGRLAFLAGLSLDANPYVCGQADNPYKGFKDWSEGWQDAASQNNFNF